MRRAFLQLASVLLPLGNYCRQSVGRVAGYLVLLSAKNIAKGCSALSHIAPDQQVQRFPPPRRLAQATRTALQIARLAVHGAGKPINAAGARSASDPQRRESLD